MSCVSRHQGRTAWCLPARDRGSGNGGDCLAGYLLTTVRQGSVLTGTSVGRRRSVPGPDRASRRRDTIVASPLPGRRERSTTLQSSSTSEPRLLECTTFDFGPGRFRFLMLPLPTGPIFDQGARDEVAGLAASFEITDRLARQNDFKRYLEDQWHLANIGASYYDFPQSYNFRMTALLL